MSSPEPEPQAAPAAPAPTPAYSRIDLTAYWPHLTLACVILIFVLCVFLWRVSELRPFLAAGGAAVAAFAGALPGLLTPDMRGKWLFAVAISAMITAGVFFATKDQSDALETLRQQRQQLTFRLSAERETIAGLIRLQDASQRDAFLLDAGRHQRALYRNRQYTTILDTARTMIEIDPDNGHGLYYAAEAYRHFGNWAEMRDMLTKFLAAAESIPESRTGAATACYERPRGYCNERVAYVQHLMAMEFLRASTELRGEDRFEALISAYRYGRADLEARPEGFQGDGRYPSSCEVLRTISRQLRAMRRTTTRVDEFVNGQEACNA